MKLEPNTDYWLSINSTRFTNFRNINNEPAEPYPISFSTRASATTKPASPEVIKANKEAIARLRKAILEDYSYFDLRKVDWEKQFADFLPEARIRRRSRRIRHTGGQDARSGPGCPPLDARRR